MILLNTDDWNRRTVSEAGGSEAGGSEAGGSEAQKARNVLGTEGTEGTEGTQASGSRAESC
jgi:hypothetical protein